MKRLLRALGHGLLIYGIAFTACANVIITGTRVVFPAADGEVTVRLTNQNTTPALIEAWIDAGDAHSTPDQVDTPFLVTPPLFRMEAHKDQSLRILFTPGKTPLPGDRESLFWLNVLEIPPKPSGPQYQGKNYLQLAIRSRLKLFYRPAALTGDPLNAPAQLTFKADGNGLVVHNPTPYYVTLSALSLASGGHTYKASTGMVAPYSDLRLGVDGLAHLPAGASLQYTCINDYGAAKPFQGTPAA
jgi:chaperone protein EcpD